MRLLLLFATFSLLSTTPLFSQKSPVKKQTTIDLKTAIDQKMVDARLEGLGGHQGASVKFICKNLKNRSFELVIPKGQLLMPAEESEQTLVVAEDLRLTVSPKTPAEGLLRTFCTEAGQSSPNVGRSFLVGAMASAQVVELLQYLGEKKQLDAGHAQNAVWSLTDKRPITYIYDNSTTEFVARQLGRVQPSYRIKSQVVESVPGRLADIGPAVEVEANFRYFLAKDAETLVVLLDHEGKQIKQISRKPEKMVAGEHRSGMKVQVWGLDKGHYTIRLQTTRGETLHDMPIEI